VLSNAGESASRHDYSQRARRFQQENATPPIPENYHDLRANQAQHSAAQPIIASQSPSVVDLLESTGRCCALLNSRVGSIEFATRFEHSTCRREVANVRHAESVPSGVGFVKTENATAHSPTPLKSSESMRYLAMSDGLRAACTRECCRAEPK
jgi:hypothetical protein